ncbi:hypothetical protein TNCV_205371 [Trichonephila clavipes]|nr:hypothetical protein TNCV_205371 [Trichonephila clavipes]
MTLQWKSSFGKSVNAEPVRNVLKKNISITAEYHKERPTSAKQIDKIDWRLLKYMTGSQQNIGKEYFLFDESKYNIFGSYGKQKFHGNQIQQCMSKNYGLLSNMEGVAKLSGATWQTLVSGTYISANGIMKKYLHHDILNRNLKQSASKLGISGQRVDQNL